MKRTDRGFIRKLSTPTGEKVVRVRISLVSFTFFTSEMMIASDRLLQKLYVVNLFLVTPTHIITPLRKTLTVNS